MPIGPATVENIIETLSWGGNAYLYVGWDTGRCEFVAPECVPGISRDFQGSFALDTAAVVPEPTSLLLLGSGLALVRLRRQRSS